VTSLLQGVIEHGTGYGAAPQLHGRLAGKTGTTNDRRDSWFGGYAPERSTVVWVGYDNNAVTRLSGARAALPIWSRFTVAVTPPGGYSTFPQPPGITSALIDPESGLLATDSCPEVFTEVFRRGEVPADVCTVHGSLAEQQLVPPPFGRPGPGAEIGEPQRPAAGEPQRPAHPFRRWLHRIFGGGNGDGDDDEGRGGKSKDAGPGRTTGTGGTGSRSGGGGSTGTGGGSGARTGGGAGSGPANPDRRTVGNTVDDRNGGGDRNGDDEDDNGPPARRPSRST